jgi:hypothetical protein
MPIVGSSPESGVRIDVSRARDGGPPWRYEGQAVTPEATWPTIATVAEDGEVRVELGAPAGAEASANDPASEAIAARVRLLLRAAYKHASDDGQPPPRRVVRWRPDAQK